MRRLHPRWLLPVLLMLLASASSELQAQQIIVNTAPLEGLDITPDNMWGFQIQSMETKALRSRIDGQLRFRHTNHSIQFSFVYTIQPGLNVFDASKAPANLSFSSSALRELFMDYKVLPQGTYQYCITVTPNVINSESVGGAKVDDCIYKQSKDLFSITLLEPEDDAKLYEYNPMLTWVATYPFLSELTYGVRIAEIKDGQNTESAITRNNAVYSEKHLVPSTMVYPVYAKPLRAWQPYAWTVDAYYKGILLGGAQPWKFTIVEDSEIVAVTKDQSYFDFVNEVPATLAAVGDLKLKYICDVKTDSLTFFIQKQKSGNAVITPSPISVRYADNLFALPLTDKLAHNGKYELTVRNQSGRKWVLPFIYYNPLYVK